MHLKVFVERNFRFPENVENFPRQKLDILSKF